MDFLFDHCEYFILQTVRCYKKMAGFFYSFSLVKCLEYICCFQPDLYSRSHIRKVCIKAAGLFVIISGSDLCIIFHSGICLSCDQAEFGMHFVAIQTVNHAASGFFQPSGPFDIIFFIETCFQLDHNKHFFAVFSCFNQSLHNFTLTSQTVQRHLDCDNRFVICRLMKHTKERFHTFKRIGKQFVFFFDLWQDRFFQIKFR